MPSSSRIDRSRLPPGPRRPKVFGLLATWVRPAGSMDSLRAQFGKRITVQLPFQPPFVILSDPQDIKAVFTAPPDVLHPGEGARVLETILGRHSVILLDEAPHLEQRRLMLPAFHGERMQRLTGLMGELTDQEMSSWPLGEPFELHPRLQRLTLEIILRAVFGLERGARLDDLRDGLTRLLAFGESLLSILPAVRRRFPWLPSVRRLNQVLADTDRLIFSAVEERRAQGEEGDDVLAMLLGARHEDGSPMSDAEIRDELVTALVAGHETTASQLAWAFERLAREPRVTAALQAELDGGGERTYLEATLQEILRLKPVLPNAEPRLVKQPITIGPYTYPPGVALLASAYLVHRDPEIYPEPHAFRPERFLRDGPGTYTWIPFGGGRRRCLGASFALTEMRIVLEAALRRYELLPVTDAPERTRRRSITFSPQKGASVILASRAARPASATDAPLAAAV